MSKGLEKLLIFFFSIIILGISIYIYYIQHMSVKTLEKPYYIDILINQLPSIPDRAGPTIRYFWDKLSHYLNDLKTEGKIDQSFYDGFVTTAATTMNLIYILLEDGVINWRYFLEEYYYK